MLLSEELCFYQKVGSSYRINKIFELWLGYWYKKGIDFSKQFVWQAKMKQVESRKESYAITTWFEENVELWCLSMKCMYYEVGKKFSILCVSNSCWYKSWLSNSNESCVGLISGMK